VGELAAEFPDALLAAAMAKEKALHEWVRMTHDFPEGADRNQLLIGQYGNAVRECHQHIDIVSNHSNSRLPVNNLIIQVVVI
jgi:hypothetical protein